MELSAFGRLRRALPEGRPLPDEVWQRRHAVLLRLAAVQALAIGVLALTRGWSGPAALAATAAAAYPLTANLLPGAGRTLRAAGTTVSLLATSVLLVHVFDGLTEAHFSFFVVVGLVSLYQDWTPFGLALAVVVLHHGLVGTLFPHSVFHHDAAFRDPWVWAAVHGGFVLAASLANLASWRLNERQGLFDPLTGLANRTRFMQGLVRLLERRSGQVSVLFLDLDDFKDVNDTLGHAAGDQLLTTVSERLLACTRVGDEVGRLGGDEFAVVVGGDATAAAAVGERVLAALAEPVEVAGRLLTVHVSLGLADTATAGDRRPGTLLRNADLAMYEAKALGKNRMVRYVPGMAEAAQCEADLLQDLAAATRSGQLEVHYQPTIDLADGRTTGYEALVRWRHPGRGLVPPAEFIPQAEASGLVVEIGRWVLERAVSQAAAWTAETGRPIGIAVNLSPRQLSDDDVVTVVARVLADTGLPAGQLTLEVTEGVLLRDVDEAVGRLAALRALGVRIAIDDFGTGYSSMAYLRRLPADVLKIDRSFVQDLGSDGRSTTLVASMIELARSLGLEVVAEGVETPQQHAVLGDLACSHAQGYLFGRPLPAPAHDPVGDMPSGAVPEPREEVAAL
ncbi:diguanylate cyclase (GGDEF) domain-containing protein [Geodermatophilus obscurus]|uniref:Diguanylate cyclase (GGDEF) domain-containing protein n=1 Tax=Geodermatophilus obscurus TaxID=1861 RepID=A0A1I5HSS6_9ACTN|nr:bifunctional diguanylate cyclase/phosphodiesterase [Geodermatophilus obscurus]SFO51060.1 diguanylate cyclase (GGDEF) domain-containing protein [Geodermatophilus obscurus]